jgi:hypothetical protein
VPDALFLVLFLFATLVFSGIALVLLIRPPLILRIFAGSEDGATNTATWRVQMRGVGLTFSLFASVLIIAQIPHSKFIDAFRDNLYVALMISFFLLPVLLWIVWKFWLRAFIRYAQIEGINEDPRWELKMTLLFCSLLIAIIAMAFFLAAKRTAQPRSVFESATALIPSAGYETECAQSLPRQSALPPSSRA